LARHDRNLSRDIAAASRAIEIRVVFEPDSGRASASRPRWPACPSAALPCRSHFWTGQPQHGPAAVGTSAPIAPAARHAPRRARRSAASDTSGVFLQTLLHLPAGEAFDSLLSV